MTERARKHGLCGLLLVALLSGCTLASGVNDYHVDQSTEVRDLDYTFGSMKAHASKTLDVAVVADSGDGGGQLQARARIMLPPAPAGAYPAERLVMTNALTPGPQTLFFFVDSLPEDNRLEAKDAQGNTLEHAWVEDVAVSGVDEFVHSTRFVPFDEKRDFTQLNGDVVLKLPIASSLGTEVADEIRACIAKLFERAVSATLEAKIFLVGEERQVGLFKTYKGNPPPLGGEARLRGIVDAGNDYRLEVYVDGKLSKSKELTAPQLGDLSIKPTDWFPVSEIQVIACVKQ